nr:hypothetical protein [uncultured Draconibacterium sp.]
MENTVVRKIYYYEIVFRKYKQAEDENRNYREIIDKIKSSCDSNYKNRFLRKKPRDENKYGVLNYKNFKGKDGLYGFKFIRMRKDVFPQIMNDIDANIEDITDAENKSIVESTHIIVDCRDKEVLRLGIEFNFDGSRINDFMVYLRQIGSNIKFSRSLITSIISNDTLEEVANKIGDCKMLKIKVLKENVKNVKEHDNELGTVLENLKKFSKSKFFTLNIRLDFEKNNRKNKDRILKFVRTFTKDKDTLDSYEIFKIEAEDTSKDERVFESFDLLMDKVKSRVKVERRVSSKVIITSKMYKLMLSEYINKIA